MCSAFAAKTAPAGMTSMAGRSSVKPVFPPIRAKAVPAGEPRCVYPAIRRPETPSCVAATGHAMREAPVHDADIATVYSMPRTAQAARQRRAGSSACRTLKRTAVHNVSVHSPGCCGLAIYQDDSRRTHLPEGRIVAGEPVPPCAAGCL